MEPHVHLAQDTEELKEEKGVEVEEPRAAHQQGEALAVAAFSEQK